MSRGASARAPRPGGAFPRRPARQSVLPSPNWRSIRPPPVTQSRMRRGFARAPRTMMLRSCRGARPCALLGPDARRARSRSTITHGCRLVAGAQRRRALLLSRHMPMTITFHDHAWPSSGRRGAACRRPVQAAILENARLPTVSAGDGRQSLEWTPAFAGVTERARRDHRPSSFRRKPESTVPACAWTALA
jgi:hypothetical protein